MDGWIKLHRGLLESPIAFDSKYAWRWVQMLLSVNHSNKNVVFNGNYMTIKSGQSFRGYDSWGDIFGCSKRTAQLTIELFVKLGMIDTEILGSGSRRKLLITINKWAEFQDNGTEKKGGLGTKSSQKLPPNKKEKKEKKEKEYVVSYETLSEKSDTSSKNKSPHEVDKSTSKFFKEVCEVYDYLNLKVGKRFNPESKASKFVYARLREGLEVEDLKMVIDLKVEEWLHDAKMKKYLRVDTLFNPEKFEKYLEEVIDSGMVTAKTLSCGDTINSIEQLENFLDDDVIIGQFVSIEDGQKMKPKDGRFVVSSMKKAIRNNIAEYIFESMIR